MNYSEKLRWMADYLDNHPTILEAINEYDSPSVRIWAEDKADFARLGAALGGCEKHSFMGIAEMTKTPLVDSTDKWSPKVYRVTVCSGDVCEKVATGNTVTRKVHVPDNAYRNEDGVWVVDEVEEKWDCPKSFLGES